MGERRPTLKSKFWHDCVRQVVYNRRARHVGAAARKEKAPPEGGAKSTFSPLLEGMAWHRLTDKNLGAKFPSISRRDFCRPLWPSRHSSSCPSSDGNPAGARRRKLGS